MRYLAASSLLVVGNALSVFAQAPAGHLAYCFPAGGQAGQRIEVTLGGSDLATAKGVRITGPGVSGEVLRTEKGKETKDGRSDDKVFVSISLAADAVAGQRDLRLITAGGATNRVRFLVGKLPEMLEKEPNSDLVSAQVLPALPVVVNGQLLEADKDFYRFSARAGQTIVCRAQAQELIPFIADAVPGWCQATLTLFDGQGNHLAYVDDFRFHPDPVLIFRVQRDGDYVVAIQDAIYRGREDFVYRLSIGELPFLTHISPLGAPCSATAKVRLFGVNLPSDHLELPPAAAGEMVRRVEVVRDGMISNALPLALGELPEVEEAEPNNTPEKAQTVTVPVTINGRIEKPGDVDCYQFSAEADQTLVLDVAARRLESPLDSAMVLTEAKGKWLAQNDDTEDEASPMVTHHADSRIVFTFKAAGQYLVKLTDAQGKGGPEYAYRLTIAPPRPDFQLRLAPDNPRIGQGASAVLKVQAIRRDGFDGPIDLQMEDLPSGFAVSGDRIPEGANEAVLSLTAPIDAPLGLCGMQVLGTAALGGQTVTRRARPVEEVMQAFIYRHPLPTEEGVLAVLEPPPYKLIPQMPSEGFIRFGEGRTAFLTVKAERKEGVKGPIRLTLYNAPKGVFLQNGNIPANQDEAKIEIKMGNQIPGNVRYILVLSGSLKSGSETLTSLSPAILTLGPNAKVP